MFGDAYDFIADKAKNAYSTVQMSQNEYLQQVNGFATGLKTALGGNEQAAAELADRIINAEADIVAATGNTAENVQNAFNGIMKSNYTMLDNLQLGITPTKEGFQEVIDKVNEWNAANGNATNYMIDNLADAQNALVDYIEMQGLAGYAANEASQTISGSLASAKAAWSNLVTGVADDNADFGKLLNNFVNSVSTAAKNLVPRVKTAITGIGQLISQTLPIIVNEIPAIIKDVVPDLLNAAMDLVSAIGQGLLDNADSLFDSALELITKLVDFIVQGLPEVLNAALQIIETLGKGLADYAPQLITSVTDLIIKLVDMLTNPEMIHNMITAALQLIIALGEGLIEAIPRLIEKVPDIINGIVTAINDNISTIIGVGVKLMTSLLDNIPAIIEGLVTSLPEIISGIVKGIGENLPAIIEAGVTLFTSLISNTAEIIAIIAENIPTITTSIIDALMAVDWIETGKDIMKAIISGMEAAVTGVLDFPTMLRNKIGGFEPGDIGYTTTFGEQMESAKANWKAFEETGVLPANQPELTWQQKAAASAGGIVVNQTNYYGNDATLADTDKANMDLVAALAAQ